jgi:hypothetical protein
MAKSVSSTTMVAAYHLLPKNEILNFRIADLRDILIEELQQVLTASTSRTAMKLGQELNGTPNATD